VSRDELEEAAWAEYDTVRSAVWDEYLAFRGPVFRYDGTETRSWAEFDARSRAGLSVYEPIRLAAWAKYLARLAEIRRGA